MSSQQAPSGGDIERTRQHIRSLVNEIAQLTKSDIAPEQFYAEYLSRVVTALAAVGGAVWITNEEGRLGLQYQVNLAQTRLQEEGKEAEQARHARLLYRVLRSGESALVPPQSGPGTADDTSEANPTDFLLVLGVLKTEAETTGVVEIFQRSEAGPSTQRGYLQFLRQMCELAGDFLKSRKLRSYSDRQSMWTRLEDFAHVIHASLDPRETAYTIANEARRLIDCDRVSVGMCRGRRCVIEAVSGQDLIDKRSNIVRLLGKLATEVVAAGDPVWYSGDTHDMPPQIEDAMQEYVDESHSKTVAVLPLKRPEREKDKEGRYRHEDDEAPFGALIVEQIENAQIGEALVHRVDVVCKHSSTALGNALEYRNLFLMPVWRALGKTRVILRARTLPWVIVGAVGVVAAVLFLTFFPADLNIQSKGTLEPMVRHDVFAKVDGNVEKLLVKHGDRVKTGELLAQLRSPDLDVALTKVTGERITTEQQLKTVQETLMRDAQERDRKSLSLEDISRLSGQLLEYKQKLKSLDAEIKLLEEKHRYLDIHSPGDGTVVTWDLFNRLNERPVQHGQVLMRVSDLEGPWRMELKMPEDRIGFITRAQQELGPDLTATYILATEPGNWHVGTVTEVHLGTDIQDTDSIVMIYGSVNKDELPPLRPGTVVTAKIFCGRHSIGYVWFHDLIGFIQSRVLFRF